MQTKGLNTNKQSPHICKILKLTFKIILIETMQALPIHTAEQVLMFSKHTNNCWCYSHQGKFLWQAAVHSIGTYSMFWVISEMCCPLINIRIFWWRQASNSKPYITNVTTTMLRGYTALCRMLLLFCEGHIYCQELSFLKEREKNILLLCTKVKKEA